MALTKEILNSDKALTDLSDDQKAAIITLSGNDEQVVMNKKIGEIHGQYDKDILAVTGVEKPQGIKTYEHMKTILANLKGKVDSQGALNEEITTLKTTVKELNKKIKDGNTDETLKTQLEEAKSELTRVQGTYTTEKQIWEEKLQKKESEIETFKVKSMLKQAAAGFTYKPTEVIAEDLRNLSVNNAINSIMETYAIEDKDGNQIFKDKQTGEILRDKDDSLNPIKPEKLLSGMIRSVLDEGQPGGGGGGKPPEGGTTPVSIKGARTQMEAVEAIEKNLLQQGKVRGTDEYQAEFDKVYNENEVTKLPR